MNQLYSNEILFYFLKKKGGSRGSLCDGMVGDWEGESWGSR